MSGLPPINPNDKEDLVSNVHASPLPLDSINCNQSRY